jgi:hypothetical protein
MELARFGRLSGCLPFLARYDIGGVPTHIDWAFVRGTTHPSAGNVLKSVKASDHFPILFELPLSAADQRITLSGFMSVL